MTFSQLRRGAPIFGIFAVAQIIFGVVGNGLFGEHVAFAIGVIGRCVLPHDGGGINKQLISGLDCQAFLIAQSNAGCGRQIAASTVTTHGNAMGINA